jgi:hypothetical protein
LLEKLLAGLGDRFDGDGVEIDRAVFNPSRIARLYGTLAAKGDDTPERPHRLSKMLKAPLLARIRTEQLEALVQKLQPAEEPEYAIDLKHGALDVDEFLSRYGVMVKAKTTEPDGTIKWILEQCPFKSGPQKPRCSSAAIPERQTWL